MTRIPYDQAAKKLLEGALASAGDCVIQREVRGEPQYVDVLFDPRPGAELPPGLLGRIVERSCLLELFHDPPGLESTRDCLCKQLLLHRERRTARAGETIVPLWIVSAGRPVGVLSSFGLRRRRGWPPGVYTADPGYGWNVVAISELPLGVETLPLRLMGAGKTLQRAVADLNTLPRNSWVADVGHPAMDVLMSSGAIPQNPIEKAILMKIQGTYEERMRRAVDQGRDQGREELLRRQFERKLARALAAEERVQLADRLARLGPDRLGDVVLDLDPGPLAAWLADPAAR
jgi:hypothetical protein